MLGDPFANEVGEATPVISSMGRIISACMHTAGRELISADDQIEVSNYLASRAAAYPGTSTSEASVMSDAR